jgi:hypothetical protein
VVHFDGRFPKTKAEGLADPPGWGCFIMLGLAAAPVFALTYWTMSQSTWDEDQLGNLLGTLVSATALGLFLPWLSRIVSRRKHRRDELQDPHPPNQKIVPYRLERERPTFPGVLLLWGVAMYWNVPLGVVAWGAGRLWMRGHPSVGLLVFLGLFALFGLLLLDLAVFALVEEYPRFRGLSAAEVLLSAHPLQPDGDYELALAQPGPIHLRNLQVCLIGNEHVPHPDGEGGTYDKIENFFQSELINEQDLQIANEFPFKVRARFHLPVDAKPSKSSAPNQVNWKVRVAGRRAGWHWRFHFDFPVELVPTKVTGGV